MPHYNLTIREKKALYKLVNDKNIVITLMDKNLGLAIMPYNKYIKALKNLLNPNDYEIIEQTEEECIDIMQTQIFNLTMTMNNKHNNYFIPEETQLPFFHALPKVYKNPLKWKLDTSKRQLSTDFSIKNQNGFKNIITEDFECLYTKFSYQEILNAIEYLNNNILPIPKHYGLTFAKYKFMLNTVISFNYFKALGKIYRQKNRIAMGTNAAVQIAQLTCYAHEHKAMKRGIFEKIFFRRYSIIL
ncbi:13880_t:CDS:2 [Cetraspora pellucida]|uniref:13880_t:CDS:1 n=1 Tax=Cetraspora pellucida TaxID=1433469 RepID=A0ACA9LY75_9GLOM|nr:13880_t:CDS:2 [Cetraspora pellucida]